MTSVAAVGAAPEMIPFEVPVERVMEATVDCVSDVPRFEEPLPHPHVQDDVCAFDLMGHLCGADCAPAVYGDGCRFAHPPADDMDFRPRNKITDYFVAIGRMPAQAISADGAAVVPSAFEKSLFYSPCEHADSGTSSGSTGADDSWHTSDDDFIDDAVEEDPTDLAFVRRFLRAYTGKRRLKLESQFRCQRGCPSRRPHIHIASDDDDGQ